MIKQIRVEMVYICNRNTDTNYFGNDSNNWYWKQGFRNDKYLNNSGSGGGSLY